MRAFTVFLKIATSDSLYHWPYGKGDTIRQTSSPKGKDCSPESQQVFQNISQVSKRFFNWSRAANSAVQSWTSSDVNQVVTLLQICNSCQ